MRVGNRKPGECWLGFFLALSILCVVSCKEFYFDVRMPSSTYTKRVDEYIYMNTRYNGPSGYVTRVETVNVDPKKNHHMILTYSYKGSARQTLQVWSHGAPTLVLPSNMGLYLPKGATLYMVVHYLLKNKSDNSGLRIYMTTKKLIPAYRWSIEIPPRYFKIPPKQTAAPVKYSCRFTGKPTNIHQIMGHAHGKGVEVSFTQYRPSTKKTETLAVINPQQPQKYHEVMGSTRPAKILPNDQLTLQCKYNTMSSTRYTYYGVGTNEMCGVYFILSEGSFSCS